MTLYSDIGYLYLLILLCPHQNKAVETFQFWWGAKSSIQTSAHGVFLDRNILYLLCSFYFVSLRWPFSLRKAHSLSARKIIAGGFVCHGKQRVLNGFELFVPTTSNCRMYLSPKRNILPSRSLPPGDLLRGVSPIHAAWLWNGCKWSNKVSTKAGIHHILKAHPLTKFWTK